MLNISHQEFEKTVQQALEELPEEISKALENIDIFIEETPGHEIGEGFRFSANHLLGLYTGIPKNHRGPYYGNVLPDRIYLYKKNLESYCRSHQALKEQIQRTVLHEIGHYFGINDKRLRELGY
jgi:predicted Zn-dependent protease with MMP-like domain